MNSLERSLQTIVGHLHRLDYRFALVGGLAVSARAEPRLTRDADLAVVVNDDHDAEALVLQLRSVGYEIAASVEQEATGRLATIRLLPRDPADQLVTDLLFASSGIEEEIVAASDDIVVFAGLSVPVATVGHLMAMKLRARDDRRRPADADDLRALAAVAQDDDWQQARTAVELITERGFARERDLVTALELLRTDGAY
jgi:predicted nucleotidyltransferase